MSAALERALSRRLPVCAACNHTKRREGRAWRVRGMRVGAVGEGVQARKRLPVAFA